jgi:hypothetical protein
LGNGRKTFALGMCEVQLYSLVYDWHLLFKTEVLLVPRDFNPFCLGGEGRRENNNTIIFLVELEFKLGLHCTCKAGVLLLEPLPQSILLCLFLEIGSQELFPWVGLKLQSSQSQAPK